MNTVLNVILMVVCLVQTLLIIVILSMAETYKKNCDTARWAAYMYRTELQYRLIELHNLAADRKKEDIE